MERVMPETTESEKQFLAPHYRRINARRLEHLVSLNLPIQNRTVLELGSGIGDLTTFFLDRGCTVTSIEGRAENIDVHKREFEILNAAARWNGKLQFMQADLNKPGGIDVRPHEVVFCYGLLYHLSNPEAFLQWLPEKTADLLILETMVTFDEEPTYKRVAEYENPSQALHRDAIRPSRRFVFDSIAKNFNFTYMPTTQPAHEQFPLQWQRETQDTGISSRAIFIGSRKRIDSPLLVEHLPASQTR
jgi:SAM-dependent methyltransferase